ncbi:RagB/SusD family nutrient uptake outer membrane protein [Bacteroides congonensis]|uniref:RagB/SusD family nutrient uptake outer membrane protein n=1 Tax=Bacteroides congonensis TaxID=1871006 RepID=UPI0025A4A812|nr:RagB/SusD family nutrient uptake outer membrane protein [Bacteroides congonensis]
MKLRNIFYAASLVIFCSCGDFLEPKSQSEYVPKDANALQEMLIGEAYPTQTSTGVLSFLEIFSDDIQEQQLEGYTFSDNHINSMEGLGAIFCWQPDMFTVARQRGYGYSNVWAGLYKLLLGANAAIDYIDDVSGTEEEKNYVVAQALGLRAFYYYLLVNYFGAPYNYNPQALGVPLKLDSGMREAENILMTRNTVGEIYDQIVKDLNEAERLFLTLPEKQQYQPDYMVSLPMIELLKSRIYLYMNNWAKAKKYAEKVIKDWNFTLIDLNGISLPDPKQTNAYREFTNYQSPEVIWLYGNITDLVAAHTSPYLTGTGSNNQRRAFKASDRLLESFHADDLRKDLYIVRELKQDTKNPDNNEYYDTYLAFGKFMVTTSSPSSAGDYFALSFRVSEAYLNYAEASAMNNAEADAIKAMNSLLENRYTNPESYADLSTLTGDALIERIREERRKELCFEGQRWFDLRRYGMPSFTRKWGELTYKLEEKDRSYTMPIPNEVLDKNMRLEQNPLAPKRSGSLSK